MTIRAIPDIGAKDRETRNALLAIKEVLEVIIGRKGSDDEDQVVFQDELVAETNLIYDILARGERAKITPDGGLAVKMTNKTGAATVKGYCVSNSGTVENAVRLTPVDEPTCMGVCYNSGIADGLETWIIVSGLAYVYFWGATTIGHMARTGLAADAGVTAGQAASEAFPAAPGFSTDAHFCKIGNVLETIASAGLAKCVLQFN